jgi:hypothetical protein
MSSERRHHADRRQAEKAALGERGMRCRGCGTVWYSAVASTVVRWGRCIRCDGTLHVERRTGGERRHARASAAA